MSLHQYDKNIAPDYNYIDGDLIYLVEGNKCRLLDGRRTEGFIEKIFIESGIFRWRITKYEDDGNFWDMDFEDIIKFQFETSASKVRLDDLKIFENKVEQYNKKIEILIDRDKQQETLKEINIISNNIMSWITDKGTDGNEYKIDFCSAECNKYVSTLLEEYMILIGCEELESLTAKSVVLNPDSGEWFKGILIIMAKLGLINYYGKMIRTKGVFNGIGTVANRSKYIIHRIAFIKAIFSINCINEVTLYRGMSSEGKWMKIKRSILHMTFSREVAEEFSDLGINSRFGTSYIIKMKLPIDKLFMTYIETAEMNERYKELEAIVIGDVEYCI